MDTGKAFGQNDTYIQETRFHRRMFAAGAFAIILFGHDNGRDSLCLIRLGHRRNSVVSAVQLIQDTVGLSIEGIDRPHQHVVRDVLQVSAETQPRSRHGDMVGGTFALGLDEQRHIRQVLSVPRSERCQFLQALRLRMDGYLQRAAVGCRRHISVIVHRKAFFRQRIAFGRVQTHRLSLLVQQRIRHRIEAEVAGYGQSHRHFRRGHKRVGIRITVRPFREIPVEGSHDGVGTGRIVGDPFPLSDTRSAGIGHDDSSHRLEIGNHTVAQRSAVNLFGTRIDDERSRHLQSFGLYLTGQRSRTAQILVRRIGTRTDKADFHPSRITVLLHFFGEFGQGTGSVRSKRTVDIRFQGG